MRVVILGCGPSGMFAAHAAHEAGCDFDILSHKVLSPMGGAQYLHEPIPGLTKESRLMRIQYVKFGTAAGYAAKVYNDPEAKTSWEEFPEGGVSAWPLRETYRESWLRYSDRIQECFIEPEEVAKLCSEYDIVISTVPAKKLCCNTAHRFDSQEVVIVPGYGDWDDPKTCPEENMILYDGNPGVDWYRASSIFGTCWTEYSRHRVPHSQLTRTDAQRGLKPIRTDCDCHLRYPNFMRLGRFGQWKKAVLTTHAYRDAAQLLGVRDSGDVHEVF